MADWYTTECIRSMWVRTCRGCDRYSIDDGDGHKIKHKRGCRYAPKEEATHASD